MEPTLGRQLRTRNAPRARTREGVEEPAQDLDNLYFSSIEARAELAEPHP